MRFFRKVFKKMRSSEIKLNLRISFKKEINLLKDANFSLKWSIHASEFE